MRFIPESSAFCSITQLCKEESPDILLITGPTGSGKSTISKTISAELGLSILSLDNYFRDEEEMELVLPDFNIRQWDAPDCYHWDILVKNLQSIFRDKISSIPIFSHECSKRSGWSSLSLQKTPLIVEGLYAMHPEILAVINTMRIKYLSVFLNIPEETRWERKYKRDVLERNEDPTTLRVWFDDVIRPAEKKWVNQQLGNADIVITHNLEEQL